MADLQALCGVLRAEGGDLSGVEVKSAAGGFPDSLLSTFDAFANGRAWERSSSALTRRRASHQSADRIAASSRLPWRQRHVRRLSHRSRSRSMKAWSVADWSSWQSFRTSMPPRSHVEFLEAANEVFGLALGMATTEHQSRGARAPRRTGPATLRRRIGRRCRSG